MKLYPQSSLPTRSAKLRESQLQQLHSDEDNEPLKNENATAGPSPCWTGSPITCASLNDGESDISIEPSGSKRGKKYLKLNPQLQGGGGAKVGFGYF